MLNLASDSMVKLLQQMSPGMLVESETALIYFYTYVHNDANICCCMIARNLCMVATSLSGNGFIQS